MCHCEKFICSFYEFRGNLSALKTGLLRKKKLAKTKIKVCCLKFLNYAQRVKFLINLLHILRMNENSNRKKNASFHENEAFKRRR